MTNVNMEMVKEYLLENMEELRQVVSDLNNWNGCLEYLDIYENDEDFFNTYFERKPMEAVRAVHYGEYNYNDEYVRFNGYGNLESLSEWDLEQEIKNSIDDIIDNLIEYQQHCYLSDELEELLKGEEEKEVFSVIDLDVWGNEEDGWEVNAAHTIGSIELTEDEWDDSSEIIDKLVEAGFLTEEAALNLVEVDTQYSSELEVEIIYTDNGKPLYTIRKQ